MGCAGSNPASPGSDTMLAPSVTSNGRASAVDDRTASDTVENGKSCTMVKKVMGNVNVDEMVQKVVSNVKDNEMVQKVVDNVNVNVGDVVKKIQGVTGSMENLMDETQEKLSSLFGKTEEKVEDIEKKLEDKTNEVKNSTSIVPEEPIISEVIFISSEEARIIPMNDTKSEIPMKLMSNVVNEVFDGTEENQTEIESEKQNDVEEEKAEESETVEEKAEEEKEKAEENETVEEKTEEEKAEEEEEKKEKDDEEEEDKEKVEEE